MNISYFSLNTKKENKTLLASSSSSTHRWIIPSTEKFVFHFWIHRRIPSSLIFKYNVTKSLIFTDPDTTIGWLRSEKEALFGSLHLSIKLYFNLWEIRQKNSHFHKFEKWYDKKWGTTYMSCRRRRCFETDYSL